MRDRDGNEHVRRELLGVLFSRYSGPLYCMARYGWRKSDADAEDLVQAFFVDLEGRAFLNDVSPTRGRLRSFLKAAFTNFLRNDVRDRGRQKHGGHMRKVAVERLDGLTHEGAGPEDAFDHAWLQLVLTRALKRLEIDSKHAERWEVFRLFELEDASPTYADVAATLGVSAATVRGRLSAARKQLRGYVLDEVKRYALDADDAQDEMRWILGS